MKFKVGDKVFDNERGYGDGEVVMFNTKGDIFVNFKEAFNVSYNSKGEWLDGFGITLFKKESETYFYIGQEVYSPLFQNKERKAVVTEILLDMQNPIRCETDISIHSFTFDGKQDKRHDFISLFQESIILPVNKPIEKPLVFEEGEIVEVSDDGSQWIPVYYKGLSGDKRCPYDIWFAKKNGELQHKESYEKIRKVVTTS